jgi:DNA-binding winged helix-turn-helix (wHTH) protein
MAPRDRTSPPPGARVQPRRLRLGGWDVDLGRRRIERDDEARTLSTKEAELLAYLATQPNVAVPRGELLRQVWGYAEAAQTRTLDVTVARLRRKLDDQPPAVLVTDRGAGYRLVVGAAAPDELFGRQDDLDAIAAAVAAGAALVTVLGLPGIGATRLARHAAEQLGLPFVDDATAEQIAPRLSPGHALVATAAAPLVLAGEHRHVVRPLPDDAGAALLHARLEAAGEVPPAALTRRLRTLAAALEGHPGLLVAAADALLRSASAGLVAAADALSPERFVTEAARDPAGPCGDLASLVSPLEPADRRVLDAAAEAPQSLEQIEELAGPGGLDALQRLLDRSLLSRDGDAYTAPLPLRLWLRDARARSAKASVRE